jgi:hypothetical protein
MSAITTNKENVMAENKDTRNATQRIEDLEKVASVLYQNQIQAKNATDGLLAMQGDVGLLKDALKLLNKKTEAIIQAATPESGISVTTVSALVTKLVVAEMADQVAAYVTNGHLTANDEVAANSYLVCEEYHPDGSLANARIQFPLTSQDEPTQTAMKGKKVGDTVSFGPDKFDAKVLEIYTMVEPKAPEVAATVAETDAAETDATDVSAETVVEAPAETAAATETTEAATA